MCSSSCIGSLTTIKSEIVSSRADKHTHQPNGAEMRACQAVEMIKSKIKETIYVYQQQLVEVSASENLDQVAAKLPTLYSMKTSSIE